MAPHPWRRTRGVTGAISRVPLAAPRPIAADDPTLAGQPATVATGDARELERIPA